jgi:hypothetical protein
MKAESEEQSKQEAAKLEPDFLSTLPESSIKTFEDALAWFRAQNPNMENNHPEDLDWQAIKAAGRRY